MADALIDRIMDSAKSRLPGAVDNNLYFELQSVLDEFFRLSTVWRERILVPVVDDTLEYEIDSADLPSRIFALYRFENSDLIEYPATLPRLNVVKTYMQYAPGDYYVYVYMTVTNPLNDDKYPTFPQWVSDRYGDVIADGLAGRLMAMPAKPYSSPQHALFYGRKFRAACSEARIEAGRQNLVGGQNWRYPRFAAQR